MSRATEKRTDRTGTALHFGLSLSMGYTLLITQLIFLFVFFGFDIRRAWSLIFQSTIYLLLFVLMLGLSFLFFESLVIRHKVTQFIFKLIY